MVTRRQKWVLPAGIALVFLTAGISLLAAPNPSQVAAGSPMPEFSLRDLYGNTQTLKDSLGRIIVIVFVSPDCPWSRGVDPALNQVVNEYAAKNVSVYCIDSSASTTVDSLMTYVLENKLNAIYLKDENNLYADIVGARKTPEVFVLDTEHKLRYHGAFDNRWSPDTVGTTNYVRIALDAILSGGPIAQPEVNAWGCGIKRKS